MRLHNKILILILFSLIIPLFGFAVYDYIHLKKEHSDRELELLKSNINFFAENISPHVWDLSSNTIKELTNVRLNNPNILEITIYDHNKNIIYSQSKINTNNDVLKLSSPIEYRDQKIGSVEFSYSQSTLDQMNFNQFVTRLLELAISTVMGVIILVYFIRKHILTKLSKLEINALQIDKMDLTTEFKWIGNDEIDVIGKTLENARISFLKYKEEVDSKTQELNKLNASLESEVKVKTEQIIQSSKLAALGEMASGIAHEINNPLAIIAGKSQNMITLLNRGSVNPKEFLPLVEKVKTTTERIAKIVRGLKTHSRFDDGTQKEIISIEKLFNQVMDLSQERFKKFGVEVQSFIDPKLHIYCSPIQIEQVLTNLLNNAYDAISDLPEKWIVIETYIDNKDTNANVCVRVIDSGPPISEEKAKIFMQPFYTTKKVGKGTGLGLSISKKIIEDHCGTLFVESNRPNATFTFRLPLKEVVVNNPSSNKSAA